jgi:hypothetical protein
MELLPVPYFHVVFTLPSQIFPKFWDPKKKGLSPVKGPREIALNYKDACKAIATYGGQKLASAFDAPKDLLIALRKDFSCLPHTAELIGLQSENGIHHSTVDGHTLEVVENLRALPEFAGIPAEYQNRVELAAYLHDIGKGPKSRWADNGGRQKSIRIMPLVPCR